MTIYDSRLILRRLTGAAKAGALNALANHSPEIQRHRHEHYLKAELSEHQDKKFHEALDALSKLLASKIYRDRAGYFSPLEQSIVSDMFEALGISSNRFVTPEEVFKEATQYVMQELARIGEEHNSQKTVSPGTSVAGVSIVSTLQRGEESRQRYSGTEYGP